jgi:hypothetical protein
MSNEDASIWWMVVLAIVFVGLLSLTIFAW